MTDEKSNRELDDNIRIGSTVFIKENKKKDK
jgi:hypothetical protein